MTAGDDVTALPPTIAQLPFFASGRFPRPDLLGRCENGAVVPVSGRELIERVRELGLGLQALGLQAGERVGLLAESSPEWLLVDFAILTSAAVTVPIYPTLSAEQAGFILRDSGAVSIVVSTSAQLDKVLAVAAVLPALKHVVVAKVSEADVARARAAAPALTFVTLDELAERGHLAIRQGWGVGRDFHDRAKRVAPDDLATIIYTSGTTGDPKGVMLTHRNLIANLTAVTEILDLSDSDVALSFLPLCHGFERMVAYVYLANGVSMIFAESIETVARDLKVVRPTVMTGVPRVYEKLQARVAATALEAGGLKAKIFGWATRVAMARGARIGAGRPASGWLALQVRLADRLVFSKIREGVGGRLRFAVSGSAPLNAPVAQWFYGIGLPVIEGYGLTETAPVLTVTPLAAPRFGRVGIPLPNVQLRIADDGEILARGENIMRGYFNRDADTREVFADGWFRTGDIGDLDAQGYLRITDRKKELLVTSGGKKIAPQPIENALRTDALIAEAIVVGDGRHFPAVVLVPDFAALLAKIHTPRPSDEAALRALLDRADVRALYQAAVDRVNAPLAQFERLKKFHLLPRELTLASGELTPTLKVKRRVIEERYRQEIEGLYR
jgi:long-chain acyl-CoA synthetase